MVTKAPSSYDDLLDVSIPDMHPDLVFSGLRWTSNGTLPEPGDQCLIAFDNNREPWVLSVWSAGTMSGGASGPAGGDLQGTYPNPQVKQSTTSDFRANEIGTAIGTAGETWIGPEGPGGLAGIIFGTAYDTYLYRKAATLLRTDGGLQVSNDGTHSVYLDGWYGKIEIRGDASETNSGIWFGAASATPGIGADDVRLYRSAPDTLSTDDQFYVHGSYMRVDRATNDWAYTAALTGDANLRFIISSIGTLSWGPGATSIDTNLYRSSAGWLYAGNNLATGAIQTSDWIIVGSNLFVRNNTGHVYFGTSDDTNLYRSAANVLKTDGDLIVNNSGTPLGLGGALANMLRLNPIDGNILALLNSGNGYGTFRLYNIQFDVDTNLYRSGAGQLTTDGYLTVARDLNVGGSGSQGYGIFARYGDTGTRVMSAIRLASDTQDRIQVLATGQINWGPGGSTATDTNLYRAAANALKTDGQFLVVGRLSAVNDLWAYKAVWAFPVGLTSPALQASEFSDAQARFQVNANGTVNWGPGNATSDVSLYRDSAGILRANSVFYAGGNIRANKDNASEIVLGLTSAGVTDARILFGNAYDTNLYRSGVGALKTDGSFTSGSILLSGAGMTIAGDTNLYRVGAATLATDSLFLLNGTIAFLRIGADDTAFGNTSGDRGVYIKSSNRFPSTTPVNGGYLYVAAGVLHYRGSGGTDTVIAPA
jgi:hypothetical protein